MKKFLLFILFPFIGFGQTVTTLAGIVGGPWHTNGTASVARFSSPSGVAVDASGNIYVADAGNNTIRKITSTGMVSDFAGAGIAGSTDGAGSAARFNNPSGVAVDASGNIYVADTGNNTIRKITSAGIVSTLAGFAGGGTFNADGTGSEARFYNPYGVAVDASGNVYVADTNNHTIRKITSTGVVSTLASKAGVGGAPGIIGSTDGTGTAARFEYPYGIAVDASGNVYVADTNNYTIRKITSTGVVSTLAGTANFSGSIDGTGSAARFYRPFGVAVDASGNVYVADDNHTIRKITSTGVVSTVAGVAGVAGSTDTNILAGSKVLFALPKGVAIDPSTSGNVYVADTYNNTIRKITGIFLGGANFKMAPTLKIYPNPATNNITLEMDVLKKANLEVIDITGKEVLEQSLNSYSNNVNIEKLTSGTYLFKVFSDEGTSTLKVIKK